MAKLKRKKLYLVGLDAAVLWIIKDLHKKYNMKGFDYFIDNGNLREMASTSPPVSAAAWPSIYTGKSPDEHGVMDFLHIDKNYSRQLIYYEPEKHNPFWETLAKRSMKCLCITPPMVLSKTANRNVVLITGWPLEPRYSSAELEKAAKKFNFDGEKNIGIELENQSLPLDKASEVYVKSINARSELAKYLIKKNDYDIAMVCYTETDRIIHFSLNNPDWEKIIAPIYKASSDFLEWLVDYTKSQNEESVIILFSDHGAQPVKNKFLTNTWLIENGYAVLPAEKSTPKKKGPGANAQKYVSEKIMKLKIRRAVYNKMPDFMKKSVEKMVDESLSNNDAEHMKIQENDLEMEKTRVFSAVSYGPNGMMWINDSRFSKPAVKNEDVEKLKKELIDKLEKLKTEEGKKLVSKIIDGRKYYKNAKSFIAPDIIFELSTGYIVDFSYYSSAGIFMKPEPGRSGDHSQNGILGCINTNTKATIKKKDPSVYDIYPFVMDYFE